VGATVKLAGTSLRVAVHATRRHSIRAWHEHWPEHCQCRGVRLSGRRGVSSRRGGNWAWPNRPPRVELVTVGVHEVAIPRGLKVHAPELDFESGWEGVRATHGVPLGPVLGANHHRDGW
jgi:hypothetical protein